MKKVVNLENGRIDCFYKKNQMVKTYFFKDRDEVIGSLLKLYKFP